jgi:hypothetical protein
MAINKYEKEKLRVAIEAKLLEHKFSFSELTIGEGKTGFLLFKFDGVIHPIFKNIRMMSHDSWVQETTLYTRAKVSLRFLHGDMKSPVIGYKIVTFKITLS